MLWKLTPRKWPAGLHPTATTEVEDVDLIHQSVQNQMNQQKQWETGSKCVGCVVAVSGRCLRHRLPGILRSGMLVGSGISGFGAAGSTPATKLLAATYGQWLWTQSVQKKWVSLGWIAWHFKVTSQNKCKVSKNSISLQESDMAACFCQIICKWGIFHCHFWSPGVTKSLRIYQAEKALISGQFVLRCPLPTAHFFPDEVLVSITSTFQPRLTLCLV